MSARSKRRMRANGHLILITLGVSACLVVGAHFLREWQLHRNATVLREHATRLKESQPKRAAALLRAYINLRPADTAARTEMAELMEQVAETPTEFIRAVLAYEETLSRNPTDKDLRLRLGQLSLRAGLFGTARKHFDELLRDAPKDGELWYLAGRAAQGELKPDDAINNFEQAIRFGHHDVDVFVRMAELLRQHNNDADEADARMSEMLQANGESAEAYCAHARYLSRFDSTTSALLAATKAIEIAPDDNECVLVYSELVISNPDSTDDDHLKIRQKLRDRIAKQSEPRLFAVLSRLEDRTTDTENAMAVLEEGLRAHPHQVDLLVPLVDASIAKGQLEEASQGLAKLRELKVPKPLLTCLEAHLTLKRGHVHTASQRLEEILPETTANELWNRYASICLARCYEKLGASTRRLNACQRVLRIDPFVVEARMGAAAVYSAGGRIEDALAMLQPIQGHERARLEIMRLHFRQVRQHSQPSRQLAALELALKDARERWPESLEWKVWWARLLVAKGLVDDADAWLLQSQETHPNSTELWVERAEVQRQDGRVSDALKTLDEARGRFPDDADVVIASIELAVALSPNDAETEIATLKKSVLGSSHAQDANVLRVLAEALQFVDDQEAALSTWQQIVTLRPDYIPFQFRLFQIAVERDETKVAQSAREALVRLDSAGGSHALAAEAIQFIANNGLRQAEERLAQAERENSRWFLVPLLRAQVADRQQRVDDACHHFLRAIELGHSHPAVYDRTAQLLLDQQRYQELDDLVQLALRRADGRASAGIWDASLDAAFQRRESANVLAMAREATTRAPSDASRHLWLGQSLLLANRVEEAEVAFRRAIELAPNEPRIWWALVSLLIRTERPDEAATIVDRLSHRTDHDASACVTLAQCFAILGLQHRAIAHLDTAMALEPRNPDILRRVIDGYLRENQRGKTEDLLNRLVEDEDEYPDRLAAWARRSLALLICERNRRELPRAVSLLETNLSRSGDAADRRALAACLSDSPRKEHQYRAVQLWKSVERTQSLTPTEHVQLAQLYELSGQARAARHHWTVILGADPPDPSALERYITNQLRKGELQDAGRWLIRLKRLSTVPPVRVESELFVRSGQVSDAIRLIEEFASQQPIGETPDDDLFARVTRWYDELFELADAEGQTALRAAAERNYQRWLEIDGRAASAYARFLGRAQQVDRAMATLAQSFKELGAGDEIAAALDVLQACDDKERHLATVESWLEQEQQFRPTSIVLQTQRATLQALQGQMDNAVETYRRILERIPQHPESLNALAGILSIHHQQHEEAMQLITRAIETNGPSAELLDTRGGIHLRSGKTTLAIADFSTALEDSNLPLHRVHLAWALLSDKRVAAARIQWQRAVETGLDRSRLSDNDQKVVAQLAEKFSSESRK